jgi:MFS transporter, DHA1 family, inner membrane transport protein
MPLLIVLGLASFVSALSIRIVDPVVPEIAREFTAATATVALLASAYSFPYAFGQPILGPLGDSVGKARVIKIALAVLALMQAAATIASSLELLFVARILAGLASGGIIPLAIAMVGDRFPMQERQLALSQILMAALTGQLVGAIGSGLVAAYVGWRVVMAISCFTTVCALVVAVLKLKSRSDAKRTKFTWENLRNGYARVFENPRAVVCYSGVFIEGLSIHGLLPYIATLLERRGAGGIREAGFVLAGLGLGGVVFTFTVGPMLRWLRGQMNLIRGGGLVCSLGMLGVAMATTWPIEMIAFSVIGLGFYMIHNSLQTQATELAPENRGAAVALHAFFFFLGQAAGPVVYGFGIETVGAFASILAAAVTMAILGLVVAHMLESISARSR